MQLLYKLYFLPVFMLRIWKAWRKQKRFIKDFIEPILSQPEAAKLPAADAKKIRSYYGLGQAIFVEMGFEMLHPQPLKTSEKHALSYYAALTGLYDDFFDELHLPEQRILDLMQKPESVKAENPQEYLFLQFYRAALSNRPASQEFNQRFYRVYQAQLKSKEQENSNLSQQEIKAITFLKGGQSLLFYRSVLEAPISQEQEIFYQKLGGLFQLESDIFDIYKDRENQIATLATHCKSMASLKEQFAAFHRETLELLQNLDISQNKKREFSLFIKLILSLGYTCLDQLESLEQSSNNRFELIQYSRKQLICDMDLLKNQLKTLSHYFSKEPKKL